MAKLLYVRFSYSLNESRPAAWDFLEPLQINGKNIESRWGVVYDPNETVGPFNGSGSYYGTNTGNDYYERSIVTATFNSPGAEALQSRFEMYNLDPLIWKTVYVDDGFAIPSQYDRGELQPGWRISGGKDAAESSDFSFTSVSDAVFNGARFVGSALTSVISIGLLAAGKEVINSAASAAGVSGIWAAAKRDAKISDALTHFANDATDTFQRLMSSGMTSQQAEVILDGFMQRTDDGFHKTAISILGGGALGRSVTSLRAVEQWSTNTATNQADHSEFAIQSGTQAYYGTTAEFVGTPIYRNDVVLDGDGSSWIETGPDIGVTGRAQFDYVAAGGGNDFVLTHEGEDVISAGSGNDQMRAGGGNDYLNGGGGFDIAWYGGSSFNYQITRNNDHTITIRDLRAGALDGTDTLINVERAAFADTTVVIGREAVSDHDGDGRSDILWQNADGTPVIWTMRGLLVNESRTPGPNPGSSWHAIGSGDFNADGIADILWRNNDGSITTWTSNGDGTVTYGAVQQVPSSWQAQHVADLNGDGRADILWRNSDGSFTTWTTKGDGTPTYGDVQGVDLSWQMKNAGDFNGDGRADILWQNANGSITTWTSNGNGTFNYGAVQSVAASWRAEKAGDFNGDGRDDILWRNDDGRVTTWLSKADGTVEYGSVFGVGTDWKVRATGDYNGDGRDDILWRNDFGPVAIWDSTGNGGDTAFAARGVAQVSIDWQIVG